MSGSRPSVAVVYDEGAVSPAELRVGLADVGDPVFLVVDSPHIATMRPVLEQLGTVATLYGDSERDGKLIRSLAPDAIITFSEPMIRITAELAAAAGLRFHDVATARVLTDKVLQRQALRAAGVEKLRTWSLRSPADWPKALAEVGLPAVLKPVRGAGSRNTHLVTEEGQGADLVADTFAAFPPSEPAEPRLVLEEYLVGRPSQPFGDFVAVESLCTPGGVSHVAISGKFPLLTPFRETGQFWPTELPEPEQAAVLELVSDALAALRVRHGFTHTEVKLTSSGPRIIEVNGRLGGYVNDLARKACGVDLVRVAALHALGQEVEVPYLRPGQVHFQHNSNTPTEPCRLLAVHGAPQLRQLEGVSGYRTFVRIGDPLPAGVMTREADVIWGVCEDHRSMVELLRQGLSILSYEYEFTDGVRTLSGTECGAWPDAHVLSFQGKGAS